MAARPAHAPGPGDDGRLLYDSPNFPKDDKGPVFDEPWQAQAFAMVMMLYKEGCFSWNEWVRALSTEIADGPPIQAQPGDGPNAIYYHQWLAALEKLAADKGLTSFDDLARRKDEWRRAYLNTKHGQPIELRRGQQP